MARFTYDRLPREGYIRLLRINTAPIPIGNQVDSAAASDSNLTALPTPRSTLSRFLSSSKLPFRKDDAKLALTLLALPLDEAPDFDAVSYTWGNPMLRYSKYHSPEHTSTPSVEVIVNGKRLLITQSLATALARIYHADLTQGECGTKSEYLWADGICINQEDLDERSSQVAQMSVIFKQAKKVLIWLGEEDEFTEDGITALRMLAKIDPDRYGEVVYLDWEDRTTVFKKKGLLDWTSNWDSWLGLEALINRPWFSRVWVIQEAVVNANNAVLCGSQVLPWVWFARTRAFLYTVHWDSAHRDGHYRRRFRHKEFPPKYLPMFDEENPFSFASHLSIICRLRRTPLRSLSSLLASSARKSHATDPRDKIYALLGLADKKKPPFLSYPDVLAPDYHVAVEVLYTRVFRLILESSASLFDLAMTQDAPKKSLRLPSWVPDFSTNSRPTTFQSPYKHPNIIQFNTHGGVTWRVVTASLEQAEIEVQGLLLDTISVTQRHNVEESTHYGDYFAELLSVVAKISGTQLAYAPTKSRFEVLWRTVIADKNPGPQDHVSPHPGEQMLAHWAAEVAFNPSQDKALGEMAMMLLALDQADPAARPEEWQTPEGFQGAVETCRRSKQGGYGPEIEMAMGANLTVMRVALTTANRLVVGPDSTRTGDEIWILAGSDFPVVLRKSQRGDIGDKPCYEYVGQAYVYGVMHGEAMADNPELASILLV